MNSRRPKLGILGGMGPLATVDFLRKLVAATPAVSDQDHMPTITYSASYIPDRTASIQGHGPSPLPEMLSGLDILARSGASCIAIPCNTAHFWYDQLKQCSLVPIFHIAEAACERAGQQVRPGANIGVLATAGAVQSRVYQQSIEARGFKCLEPEPDDLNTLIMPAIYQVKAGNVAAAVPLLDKARDRLVARGADRIILGCTEIPIALPVTAAPGLLIDATEALAYHCVNWWIGERGHLHSMEKQPAASAQCGTSA
ncbi:aspartate/glutamate racemase family protein [Pseudorhodoplanes sp.]|uniref:aspartate/glutamate racemase family protein n=1 Tax=Pseudorhodoplanes sp. TaxID=1934341 RepID=UPI003D0EE714